MIAGRDMFVVWCCRLGSHEKKYIHHGEKGEIKDRKTILTEKRSFLCEFDEKAFSLYLTGAFGQQHVSSCG
jgi:hypothetical protein